MIFTLKNLTSMKRLTATRNRKTKSEDYRKRKERM